MGKDFPPTDIKTKYIFSRYLVEEIYQLDYGRAEIKV